MTLAVVNPNASELVTDRIAARLREVPPPLAYECLTNTGAPDAIESLEDLERSERALLELVPPDRYQAIVVAGFVDPGVERLRARQETPVVGMGSAALFAASSYGHFGIVTVRPQLEAVIEDFVRARGHAGACVGVTSLDIGVLGAARDKIDDDAAVASFAVLTETGASAICLGSGSLAHLASGWQPLSPVPLIDGVTEAAMFASAIVGDGEK